MKRLPVLSVVVFASIAFAADAGATARVLVVFPEALEPAAVEYKVHRETFSGNCYSSVDVAFVSTEEIDDIGNGDGDLDGDELAQYLRAGVLAEEFDSVLLLGCEELIPTLEDLVGGALIPSWDDLLVDANGDRRADLPIGRVPASSLPEASAWVSKLVAYDESDWLSGDRREWLFPTSNYSHGCVGNPGGCRDGQAAAEGVSQFVSRLPAALRVSGCGASHYGLLSTIPSGTRHDWVRSEVNNGLAAIVLTGTDAAFDSWSRFIREGTSDELDLGEWSNNTYPVAFGGTCEIGRLHELGSGISITRELLVADGKGIVGAVGPTATVRAHAGLFLIGDLLVRLSEVRRCGDGSTLGDEFHAWKGRMLDRGAVQEYEVHRMRLLADPAIRFVTPGAGLADAVLQSHPDGGYPDRFVRLDVVGLTDENYPDLDFSRYEFHWHTTLGSFAGGFEYQTIHDQPWIIMSCPDQDCEAGGTATVTVDVQETGFPCNHLTLTMDVELHPVVGGGCPTVQAKPYGQWIDVNSVFSDRVYAGSAESEDFIHVDPPAAASPTFQLRITESDPDNFTLLDFAELHFVDRPIASSAAVSQGGTPYGYDTWTSPDSVWLALGVDVTTDLAEQDSLDLTVAEGDTVFAVFADDLGPTRIGLPGVLARNKPLLVQQDLSGQGEWGFRMLPEYGVGAGEPLLPRQGYHPAFADSPLVVRGDGVADTVAWSVGTVHKLDQVFLLDGTEVFTSVIVKDLQSAVHSDSGTVTALVAADDDQYLRIDHGQYVTLSFPYPGVPSGHHREIILRLKGTYEHITAPFTSDPIAGLGLPWGFRGVYPNPTTGRTRVEFKANGVGRCLLSVYDVGGRRIRTLMDEADGQATLVNTEWDGYDDRGKRVASGVYFIRLQEGKEHEAEKLVVLR